MRENILTEIDSHTLRVAQISRILADESGAEDAALIEACALLHDIGKLAIPPEIINKPGKLTPEEFATVKTHAALGSESICRMIHLLEMAAIIARFHHEKWSGGGYEGLASENIHPYARIVAVADVFDALASKRPYKDGWALEDVFAYMKAETGKHFDPACINTLLSCREKITQIYEGGLMNR